MPEGGFGYRIIRRQFCAGRSKTAPALGRPNSGLPGKGVISYNQVALDSAKNNPARNRTTKSPGNKKPFAFPQKNPLLRVDAGSDPAGFGGDGPAGLLRRLWGGVWRRPLGGGGGLYYPPPPQPIDRRANPFDRRANPWRISHPFYGYTRNLPYHDLNAIRLRQRRADTVVIGLLGGSVARDVKPYLRRALNRWFAANELPRQPVVLGLVVAEQKQPQQAVIVANTLLLGGEFDLVINLDGFNEMTGSAGTNSRKGIFPFYPSGWNRWVGLTSEEILLAGAIGILRRERARLAAVPETSPLRRSAVFGLANRYRQERTAAAVIRLNHELAATESVYRLGKHGPRRWPEREGAARLWYRSSLMLARLAELAGADYYHFLQPNQYVPDSKPLSPEELERAYAPGELHGSVAMRGYPLLREFRRDLQRQGVNYFDLTGIFVDRPETLYIDDCCHLNDRGNELLAAAMVQRLEPALLRLGADSPDKPVSALAAALLPAAPPPAPDTPEFQVSISDDGQRLRYVREGCVPEDTESVFFLRLIPQDLTALTPRRRDFGIDLREFSFAEGDGHFARGQCTLQLPLPDYPIAALQTGQYVLPGESAALWTVELIVPADPAKLRADYAALSATEPAARDYFDLYRRDDRLIYRREICAPADTAAEFFLHIFPEDVADLPEKWQWDGYAWLVFTLASRGGHFDGKCLATVPLPDYPIKEIRTGQYIPGQGDLWSVELIVPSAPDKLRAAYAALAAAEPVARDYFNLYDLDNRLIYLRETCAAADTAAEFFLYIVPQEITDLPEDRRAAGFIHSAFAFAQHGGPFDGKCLAAVSLPDYPVKEMRTGQHIPGQGDLWSVELIAAPDFDQLRADYTALSTIQQTARDYFDLYAMDNRLLYLRETCAAADTAAGFFLHIVPEDGADLPADRRDAGFAHGGFEFVRQGGHFDGMCLAAVSLPDYPIKEMRTGQHIPGQGDLWSAVIAAP